MSKRSHRCNLYRQFQWCLIGFLLWIGLHQSIALSQQQPVLRPAQQVQQGIDRYQTGDYRAAISLWTIALEQYRKVGDRTNTAIVLENLARAYQQLGQSEVEINYWQALLTLYRQQGNQAETVRILVEQAQAYSRDGQLRKAIALLCHPDATNQCDDDSALHLARSSRSNVIETAALGSLGDAYRLLGDYQTALGWLNSSLELAKKSDRIPDQIAALNALGNVYSRLAEVNDRRAGSVAQREDKIAVAKFRQRQQTFATQAIESFDQSLQLARQIGDRNAQVRSLLGKLSIRMQSRSAAEETIQQVTSLLEQLPLSRYRVYAMLDLAHLSTQLRQGEKTTRFQCSSAQRAVLSLEPLLQQAVSIAQALRDRRAESFALGELGQIYECQGDMAHALTTTQSALQAAEQEPDSRYLWEWQAGRILKAQARTTAAIAQYNQAIATLEPIRSDLLTTNPEVQFDFRDAIEPIYREAIALQVDLAEKAKDQKKNRQSEKIQNPKTEVNQFDAILKMTDSLRLAELQNYFGSDCVLPTPLSKASDVARAMTSTAVVNSIILSDRTVIVVSFPNGTQQWNVIPVDAATLRQEVNQYRRDLERYYDAYTPERAQKLYEWIVQPFAIALEQAGIRTLVFIHDGILRTVPMAALHDGQQFLVQRYAVVTSPSLSLTDLRISDRNHAKSLAMGLTQSVTVDGQYFPALPNVQVELQKVQERLPKSQVLLDQEFSRNRLGQSLSQTLFPVLHIATHAQFGTDPADTFLVTGDRQKLTITELDRLIRRSNRQPEAIDLLALTACQTAVGDDRAALGVAGVAIQAGVKSALASLWFINDAATAQFVNQFYTDWQESKLSKAEALQKAQQALIASETYAHPAYWAPFILVGNWL
ncbi:CHAT domain-containing protein (plasmid) [Kovacikia minuta CCNUW1]|uniref:CHAT domain-containing protein n=1 Tax=Kovacikia minuta TaxID=2931930 RepID=UPI001CCB9858|nr:CHAT domain-containing protein [Kovacikia minuta]UBF30426.1 CHAT domain-containing protein [Kovacikia minuta CCNUW1]